MNDAFFIYQEIRELKKRVEELEKKVGQDEESSD